MAKEILMVVDSVSNEKGVSREVIFQALEQALVAATKKNKTWMKLICALQLIVKQVITILIVVGR